MQAEEMKAKAKAQAAQDVADDAERDLDEALSVLDAAPASLRNLNKRDVREDNIPDSVIKAIQPYIVNQEFQPAAIAEVSKADTSICQWVRAMHKYRSVAKVVEPKRVVGLSNTTLSVVNGIIAQSSQSGTLYIDLQGQANKWIRNLEKMNNLEVSKLSVWDFFSSLESAITFGKPFLLENVIEELDVAHELVLLKKVPAEQPVLEEARNQLIVSNAEMRQELKETEEQTLYRLSTSEGNPVYDLELI